MEYVYPYQSAFVFSGQTQIGRRAFLGISAGIAFRLDDPRILSHIAPVWQTLNQAGATFPVLDQGMPKKHAEWLLAGHATSAGSGDSWTSSIMLDGQLKRLSCRAAHGSREARVAVDHRNAWQGELSENPVGRPAGDTLIRLASPLLTAHNSPFAATTPIPPDWSARQRRLPRIRGTLSDIAQNGSHMGYPADLDRRFFQLAPEDQWHRKSVWPPGAYYELRGFGQDARGFSGHLPILQMQIAVKHRQDSRVETLSSRLQTIWFLPDAALGVMVWHADTDIRFPMDDDSIECIFAACKPPADQLTVSDIERELTQRSPASRLGPASKSDAPLLPSPEAGWVVQGMASVNQRRGAPLVLQPYAVLQAQMLESRRQMAETQAAFEQATAPQPPIPTSSIDIEALAAQADLPAILQVREHIARGTKDLHIENLVIPGENFVDSVWTGVHLKNVRFTGCQFERAQWRECHLENVRFEHCRQERMLLKNCHWILGGAQESTMQDIHWQDSIGEQLTFEQCTLDGMYCTAGKQSLVSYQRCQGTAIRLNDTSWEKISLHGCQLPDLNAQRVSGDSLFLVDCKLSGMHWEACKLNRLSLIMTEAIGSRWQDCHLTSANMLKETSLAHARWTNCRLDKVNWAGLEATGMYLEQCTIGTLFANKLQAPDSQWHYCDMDKSMLLHANLEGADFTATSLRNGVLYGAMLADSRFSRSNLIGVQASWARGSGNLRGLSNLTTQLVSLPEASR